MCKILQNVVAFLPYAYVIPEGTYGRTLGTDVTGVAEKWNSVMYDLS